MRNPGRYLLAAAVVTSVLVAAPLALGAGEGRPLDGGARNPSDDARQNYTRETEIIADVSTYATRQSNKSATGGGAVYGCRATATSGRGCLRASNLADGLAFSFAGQGGTVGRIEADSTTAKPFTTNATGVADGLNADRVDSKNASELTTDAVAAANLFARVGGASGTLGANRGATTAVRSALGVYVVTFGSNIGSCAYNATPASATPATATVEGVDANNVRVRTFIDDGTSGVPEAADSDFHLTVTC
jgi:peptidoglycan hydrolase-like protein with peptidoglycan-binding domain